MTFLQKNEIVIRATYAHKNIRKLIMPTSFTDQSIFGSMVYFKSK